MRILNVSAQKPDSTGSGVFLAQMVRCQVAAGHEAAVVCGVSAEDEPEEALPDASLVRPVRFKTPELPFAVCGMSDAMPYEATRYRDLSPYMLAQFKAAFTRALSEADALFQPDVVICHHLYEVTALAREVMPHRVVAGLSHSTDLRQLRQHDLDRGFIIRNVRSLDVIFALHEAQSCEIAQVFGIPEQRIRVIGTGYDARVFNCREREASVGASSASAPNAGCPRILYVGKIARAKGVESLLEASDLLVQSGVPHTLELVGGYSDEAAYQRIRSRAQRCANVPVFRGKLEPKDVADRYRASDVFVLPSFFEGLPLVIAEALACGCRVVATDLPGVRAFYERFASGAPITFVEPPRMQDVDAPLAEDLPSFERRLARALASAALQPACAQDVCDVSDLSWERLSDRVLKHVGHARA